MGKLYRGNQVPKHIINLRKKILEERNKLRVIKSPKIYGVEIREPKRRDLLRWLEMGFGKKIMRKIVRKPVNQPNTLGISTLNGPQCNRSKHLLKKNEVMFPWFFDQVKVNY